MPEPRTEPRFRQTTFNSNIGICMVGVTRAAISVTVGRL